MALLLTLVGIWRGNALLVSMCAVGILLPQLLWVTDFAAGFAGIRLTGMTTYMFNPVLAAVPAPAVALPRLDSRSS